jgi:hypothetical protein
MAESKDWYPGTRAAQLAMAKKWVVVLDAQGVDWGVPAAVMTEFSALTSAADGVLTAAMSETTRTPVVTAHCREVFGHLEDKMRDIKRRFFFIPPLDEAAVISLGLKLHDNVPSPSGEPTSQVTVETFLVGRHELGLKIVYVTGNPDDPANKEYRVYYKVVAPGESAPEHPRELPESFPTKRRRDIIKFDYGDSGKTVYMAVQIENGGKKGPWGPMTSALIP